MYSDSYVLNLQDVKNTMLIIQMPCKLKKEMKNEKERTYYFLEGLQDVFYSFKLD